jgi:FtsP/CotA-like multicopper oxidase with cupredoxin domain
LDHPVEVESVRLGVAERADVVIDLSQYAGKTLYIETRLEQQDGRGPTGKVLPAGQGNLILEIVVSSSLIGALLLMVPEWQRRRRPQFS